jgi:hypothetical protein
MKMPQITTRGRSRKNLMQQSVHGARPRAAARYRAVALDVDGTMVGPDFVVSSRLRDAIGECQRAGAVVSLATGRMMRSAERFAAQSGAAGPVVCYQGAMTFMPGTREVLRHVRLPAATATDAIEFLSTRGAHVNVYVDDEVHVEAATPWATGYASRMEIELRVVPSLRAVARSEPTLVLGVTAGGDAGVLLTGLNDRLGGSARITHSLPHFCEVGSPLAGKELALADLSDRLAIPRSQFIAFGDGKGDAGMLSWAGLGVAIEGGHPDTIAAAHRTAPGPGRDGVALVLEELLAQGRIGS